MGGRRRRTLVAVLVALVGCIGLGSCGDDDGPSAAEREAAIMTAVITDFVLADQLPVADDEPLPIVYMIGTDGKTVAADVQAMVVKPLKDDVELRFVDLRDDAIVIEEPDQPVKDDGVLVTLAPPPPTGSTVQFEVEVYRSTADEQQYLVTLAGGGTLWKVRSAAPI